MRRNISDEQLDQALGSLYTSKDVPESYQTAWRAAIRREESIVMEQKRKTQKGAWMKKLMPVAAALVLVVGTVITGQTNLGGQQGALNYATKSEPQAQADTAQWSSWDFAATESADESYDAGANSLYSRTTTSGSGAAAKQDQSDEKIIRTASLTLKTTDFQQSLTQIEALVGKSEGYVERLYQSGEDGQNGGRYANYTLRIPAANLDSFLSGLEGVARVADMSQTRQDKSAEYQDTASRLKTQQDKMARLQALFQSATEVSDIIEIENAIADTQYLLDSYQTSLNTIDRKVEHSTVSLTLEEEKPSELSQIETLSLGERIQNGFAAMLAGVSSFFQNMLVFLTVTAPIWLGILVIWIVVRLIIKHKKPNHKED